MPRDLMIKKATVGCGTQVQWTMSKSCMIAHIPLFTIFPRGEFG